MKKEVKERFDKLVELGCVVCLIEKGIYTPPEIHHPFGRTGDGHMKTYPLCFWHHRSNEDCETHTSRHPYKFKFEERYESDEELLRITNELL